MEPKWDVFISYAAENRSNVAGPLAEALRRAGARVWFDDHQLTVGDSLTEKIDEGLSQSRFGVVILSQAFFEKHWPRRELAGLRAREEDGRKVILPVWHKVDKETVSGFSPILADAVAASTHEGIDAVARKIIDAVFPAYVGGVWRSDPWTARRLVEILEASPGRTVLIDFLRFHVPRIGRLLDWGGFPVFEKYELYGVEFDAYALYAGHGLELTLVSFTDAWSDPFEHDQGSTPKVRDEILRTVATAKSIQRRFANDSELNLRIGEWLLEDAGETRSYIDRRSGNWKVDLLFFLYAGRRSEIDATAQRHNAWSRLRDTGDGIVVKTYDHLLDKFLVT